MPWSARWQSPLMFRYYFIRITPAKIATLSRSLRRDYYSVMYDGGHLSLAENISEMQRFAEIVYAAGANLESEIGLFWRRVPR